MIKTAGGTTIKPRHRASCRCGIDAHRQRRSDPEQHGHNVDSLEGVNPYGLGLVPVYDGINHPADCKS